MADVEQLRFRRGVMSLVALALLEREDMYGYQLVEEVSKRSGGLITTQEGSLYPVLYKLEDAGLISSRKIPVGKRRQRILYHLEPAGTQQLREMVAEYRSVVQGVFMIIGEEHE